MVRACSRCGNSCGGKGHFRADSGWYGLKEGGDLERTHVALPRSGDSWSRLTSGCYIQKRCYGLKALLERTHVALLRFEKMVGLQDGLGGGLKVFELGLQLALGIGVHPINEEDAVQMVGLVLDGPGEEAAATEFDALAFLV